MKTYQTFHFDSYDFNESERKIELRYSLDQDVQFVETIVLPKEQALAIRDQASLEHALFALHLIGGMSYYKTYCPQTIEIHSGVLSAEQAEFWNTVYTKGLGEFFYNNKIDFRNLMAFPATDGAEVSLGKKRSPTGKSLVPIGGGKDSIVTINKLTAEKKNIMLMRVGGHPLIDAVVQEIGLPCTTIQRHLSRELFTLNAQGAYNGHVPITAYISLLSVVLAELYGMDSVVLSDEQSANYGNVEYLDMEINHQWSKSDEAEQLIRAYIRDYIDPNISYENPLRDMTELEVIKEFATHPEFFELFTSCNNNWKIVKEAYCDKKPISRWCTQCPKCAFVFALMAAYVPKDQLISIFGSNLYDDDSLLPLYKQLLGLEGFKPFECVGTPEETKEAFALAHKRGDLDDTPIMKRYLKNQ